MLPLTKSEEGRWSLLRLLVTALWAPVEIAVALTIGLFLFNPVVEIALHALLRLLRAPLAPFLALKAALKTLPEPPDTAHWAAPLKRRAKKLV